MTLRNKLILGFSLILLLMTFVASFSMAILYKQNLKMDEIVASYYEKIRLL